MDIPDILRQHEGKTLEFKRDDSPSAAIARTAVAFANTAGGRIVIGVADKSREVVGVDDPLQAEERLANIFADSVVPRIVPDIEIVAWRDTALVVARIYPGPSRPYHLKTEGPREGVYVRVGSTNRHADPALVADLGRTAQGHTYDEQPMPESAEHSLDAQAIQDAFEGNRVVRPADYDTLRLTTTVQGRRVPTVGGTLLFGSDRLTHFPDAWIQAARFRGDDRSVIVDSLDITAPLHQAVDQALAFVRRNIAVRMELEGARRADVWQYPQMALREAIVNAVVHADYSQQGGPLRIAVYDERIEVENPGLLVPGLTFEDLYEGVSKLRNRVIGRVFREIGLIEQWGSGIGRMVSACRAAGLPDPELREIGLRFRVTLRASRDHAPELDPLDERVLDVLSDAPQGLSTTALAEHIGRTSRATRTRLRTLVDSGLLIEVGSAANDPQRRYVIAEDRGEYSAERAHRAPKRMKEIGAELGLNSADTVALVHEARKEEEDRR
ncbi:MAG: helix-turn-helix domain-containing protein [Coriobacteriia bacterium]|nr:helix-turn-helix domain-containing protein [Coriobacteriia bacterium]